MKLTYQSNASGDVHQIIESLTNTAKNISDAAKNLKKAIAEFDKPAIQVAVFMIDAYAKAYIEEITRARESLEKLHDPSAPVSVIQIYVD